MSENKTEDLGNQHEGYKSYELSMCVRDRFGNPTGEMKHIHTNNSDQIDEFWQANQPKLQHKPRAKGNNKNRRRGKGNGNKERIPTAKEANTIMKTLYKDSDK